MTRGLRNPSLGMRHRVKHRLGSTAPRRPTVNGGFGLRGRTPFYCIDVTAKDISQREIGAKQMRGRASDVPVAALTTNTSVPTLHHGRHIA